MTSASLNHRTGLFAVPASPKPLREHQLRAIGMLRQSIRSGCKRPVLMMPTGAGKTRTAAEIVAGALAKGERVAFTVPAISLVDQTVNAFEDEGILNVGVMQANHVLTNELMPVQVCSVQTLSRRDRPDVSVVIVDEAHMQFAAIRDWMADKPKIVFIGLSATPWARGMADDWGAMLIPVTMQELIDRGLLSPFRAFAPSHPDMSKVRRGADGDYRDDDAAEAMGKLTADVVATWLEKAERRPSLIFAVNRDHAKQLVESFEFAGIPMGYCDAYTDLVERQFLIEQVRKGQLAGIVNIGTLTTGVDAPFISCIVLARPTRSEMLFVQMVGRGLRTCEGKADCLILDHADNHARMGFVTDIHHDRLLSGREERPKTAQEKGEPTPKECGQCGQLKPPKVRECPACGFTPTRQSTVETEDGELIEITKPKKPVHSWEDKQRFWSMALQLDDARGKGGKLAKGLFMAKFKHWPDDFKAERVKPDSAFMAFEHSRRIAYANSKRRFAR